MALLDIFRDRRQPEPLNHPVKEPREQFSPEYQTLLHKQRVLDKRFEESAPNGSEEYLDAGNDNDVYVTLIEGRKYALKQLKPSSREYSVFGRKMRPEAVPLNGMTTKYDDFDRSVDIEEVAEDMRLMHNLVTLHLGENIVVPKAIITSYSRIYSIQPFIHNQLPMGEPETSIQAREKFRFYENIRQKWTGMTHSQDFYQLPSEVQSFCNYYPPDNGSGTNAFFRGLGLNPPFVLIDY